jgi:hypothetical protein
LLGRAAAATRDALSAVATAADLWRALLRAAVAEGYGAALTLSRRDADGLCGCAEVSVLLGKADAAGAMGAGGGGPAAALAHFAEAARLYGQALSESPPAALGAFAERGAVGYNAACAAALAGDAAGAAALLRELRALGHLGGTAADVADLRGEEDLRAVWSLPGWEGAVFGSVGAGGERSLDGGAD